MNPFKIFYTPEYLFNPRQIIIRLKRSLFKRSDTECHVRLPWGDKIKIRPTECIGSNIWHYGIFDLIVGEALARLVDEGDSVIDVGANIGQMTSLLQRLVGTSGSVDAFEPHPEIFNELKNNSDSWRTKGGKSVIKLHKIGLSNINGEGQMILPDSWDTNRGIGRIDDRTDPGAYDTVKIDIRTLADIIPDGHSIGLCKIDVEGHEYKALLGAESLLKHHRIRDIVFEELNQFPSEVHRLLVAHGYQIFALWSKPLRPVLTQMVDGFTIPTTRDGMNYLATIDPDRARRRFAGFGWKVLSL